MGGSLSSPSVKKLKGEKTRFYELFCHSGEFCSFIRRVQNLVANYLIRSLATIFTMSLHSVLAKLFKTAKSDTAFQGATTLLNFIITKFLPCPPHHLFHVKMKVILSNIF